MTLTLKFTLSPTNFNLRTNSQLCHIHFANMFVYHAYMVHQFAFKYTSADLDLDIYPFTDKFNLIVKYTVISFFKFLYTFQPCLLIMFHYIGYKYTLNDLDLKIYPSTDKFHHGELCCLVTTISCLDLWLVLFNWQQQF